MLKTGGIKKILSSHQLDRRNLSPGELIYANSMVAEEIALENKEKVSKAVIDSNKNRNNSNCVQMDACEKSIRDRSTNTREQVAKMSGVGTGTVARYDAIMKTDVLTCLNPTFVVEVKSVVLQKKLEDVLKNWKDYMVLNMGTINMIGLQIILSPPKHSPILQRKWISRCKLFKTINFLQI